MNDSEEKKPIPKLKVVSMMSKITEDKLTGPNYLEWSKIIRIYVRSVRMGGHLTKDPLAMIRKSNGWRRMLDCSSKSVILSTARYCASLINVNLLKN